MWLDNSQTNVIEKRPGLRCRVHQLFKRMPTTRGVAPVVTLTAAPAAPERPQSAEAHHTQGRAVLEKRQTDQAIAELRSSTALRPGNADAHNALGLALGLEG